MLNQTGQVVIGTTLLPKEVNQMIVSFDMPPELKETTISFVVIAINCAGRSFSQPVYVGKVLSSYS